MNSLELFPTPLLHCPSCLAHFQLSIMSHNTVTSEAFRILDSAESLMVYKACFVHNNPLLDTCKHLAKKTVNFHLFSILSLSIFRDHRNDFNFNFILSSSDVTTGVCISCDCCPALSGSWCADKHCCFFPWGLHYEARLLSNPDKLRCYC